MRTNLICREEDFQLTYRTPAANRRLAKWRVMWLSEHLSMDIQDLLRINPIMLRDSVLSVLSSHPFGWERSKIANLGKNAK